MLYISCLKLKNNVSYGFAFFSKINILKVTGPKSANFVIRRHARDLKMAITFIPLVPQKTVKYKSCSWNFYKSMTGLKNWYLATFEPWAIRIWALLSLLSTSSQNRDPFGPVNLKISIFWKKRKMVPHIIFGFYSRGVQ